MFWRRCDGGRRRRGLSVAEPAIREPRGDVVWLTAIAVARGCSTCSRWSKGRTGSVGIPRRSSAWRRARTVIDGGEFLWSKKVGKVVRNVHTLVGVVMVPTSEQGVRWFVAYC